MQRASDGAVVLSHQPGRSLQPASTLKVLTALAALEKLGPAYRGRTELSLAGEVVDGALEGDLYLRGFGNVDFTWQAFERMLHRLRNMGIREVRGDLVLDLGFFRPARADLGVPPFDEAPEFRYNVIPDALALNMNLVELDLVSDARRMGAVVMTPVDGVTVESRMRLVDRPCEDWEDYWKIPSVDRARGRIRIRLEGEFPRNCSATTAINVIDRVEFAERVFRALWTRMGGTFGGRARQGEAPAGARLAAEHHSRPLSQLMHDIVKRSDNPVARIVFLTLGALSDPTSAEPTARLADAEVRAWMERRGIDPKGLVLENGSGLSRLEKATPAQLAAVLAAARASEWAPELAAALPIVAIDGGMRRRLRGTPAAERSRIKTGTLRDSTAGAGYVKDEGGETYLFVAIVNHPNAKRYVARPIVDALIEWVARGRARN